jgi:hypothetical protein
MAKELRHGPDILSTGSMAAVTLIRKDTPFTCELYKNSGTVVGWKTIRSAMIRILYFYINLFWKFKIIFYYYYYYYYLTAIGLTPGGSSTVHIYTRTNSTQNTEDGAHITIKKKRKLGSAGRALSLRVIPWHLPYNWGKSTDKPHLV